MTKNRIEYAGFTIQQSDHCGAAGEPGWAISKNGANPMPGATFAKTEGGAVQLVDVYMAVGLDVCDPAGVEWATRAQRFWHLLRACRFQSPADDAIDASIRDQAPRPQAYRSGDDIVYVALVSLGEGDAKSDEAVALQSCIDDWQKAHRRGAFEAHNFETFAAAVKSYHDAM